MAVYIYLKDLSILNSGTENLPVMDLDKSGSDCPVLTVHFDLNDRPFTISTSFHPFGPYYTVLSM